MISRRPRSMSRRYPSLLPESAHPASSRSASSLPASAGPAPAGRTLSRRALGVGALGGMLSLAACAGASEEIGDPDAAAGSLAAVSPKRIIIQTDWFATPERAPAYNLIGPGGDIDTDKGAYIGEIGDTGVEAEIRIGGPYIGGQAVTAQMYADQSIHLGVVATDVAIRDIEKFPTTAVFTTMQKSPFMLMYGPDALPEVSGWADVRATGAPVLHATGMSYVDFLVSEGLVAEEQLDGSFDGSPSRFVAEDGRIFQQGYISNEPYRWEHDVPEWDRPVKTLLLEDAGYHVYQQAFAVRSDQQEPLAECLTLLVPLLQQAAVDYLADPEPLNDTFLEISRAIQDGPPVTAEGNSNAVRTLIDQGLVDNGVDGAYGSFDLDRVSEVVDTMTAVFSERGTPVPEIDPADICTNEYIDPAVAR